MIASTKLRSVSEFDLKGAFAILSRVSVVNKLAALGFWFCVVYECCLMYFLCRDFWVFVVNTAILHEYAPKFLLATTFNHSIQAGELADSFRMRKAFEETPPTTQTRSACKGARWESWLQSRNGTSIRYMKMMHAKLLKMLDGSVETADLRCERANRRLWISVGDAGSPFSRMLSRTKGGLRPAHQPPIAFEQWYRIIMGRLVRGLET